MRYLTLIPKGPYVIKDTWAKAICNDLVKVQEFVYEPQPCMQKIETTKHMKSQYNSNHNWLGKIIVMLCLLLI